LPVFQHFLGAFGALLQKRAFEPILPNFDGFFLPGVMKFLATF
jgi:hypothetical protein